MHDIKETNKRRKEKKGSGLFIYHGNFYDGTKVNNPCTHGVIL